MFLFNPNIFSEVKAETKSNVFTQEQLDNIIKSRLEAEQRKYEKRLQEEEKQKEITEKTLASNNKLIEIVKNLLDVSRIEAGRFGYNFKLQSLEDVVEKVIKASSGHIKEKELQLYYEKPILINSLIAE